MTQIDVPPPPPQKKKRNLAVVTTPEESNDLIRPRSFLERDYAKFKKFWNILSRTLLAVHKHKTRRAHATITFVCKSRLASTSVLATSRGIVTSTLYRERERKQKG